MSDRKTIGYRVVLEATPAIIGLDQFFPLSAYPDGVLDKSVRALAATWRMTWPDGVVRIYEVSERERGGAMPAPTILGYVVLQYEDHGGQPIYDLCRLKMLEGFTAHAAQLHAIDSAREWLRRHPAGRADIKAVLREEDWP